MKPIPALLPLSWIYGSVMQLRNLFFDMKFIKTERVNIPVISIGNITAGGTGKTPFVEMTARLLQENGKKVAVISRGYGRTSKGLQIVSDGEKILCDAAAGGDEAVLLAEKLPQAVVIVDEIRFRGATTAAENFHADVILLDDGFQHRKLHRNLDIVLNDSQHSAFATPMLPAGYRREPIRGLKRADAVVWTKLNEKDISQDELQKVSGKKIFSSSFEPVALEGVFIEKIIPLEQLKRKPVFGFCGTAQPENFKKTLQDLEMLVMKFRSFPDHHLYTKEDALSLFDDWKSMSSGIVLTTEKDAVKFRKFETEFYRVPLFTVKMNVRIHQPEEWKKMILEAVKQ